MKRVLYDNQIFEWQKFGGISRYFVELMSNLNDIVIPKFPYTLSDNVYLTKKKSLFQFWGKNKVYRLFDRTSSILSLRQDFDIFHPTYYNPYFLKYLRRPYVITVHDMIHERFPNLYKDETVNIKRKSILNAHKIIAISEYTKKDIIDIYGIDSSKIEVIYHGVTIVAPKKPEYVPKDYILYTGQRMGYKNFKNLCIAFADLIKEFPLLKLVCTGPDFTHEELSFMVNLGIINNVVHIFASESELAFLYKNAQCFVYPSLYEGFGIPILEAFGYECPLCLSDTSCFPEIAADCGAYFDPNNPESIANTIATIISNSKIKESLIKMGTERLKNFSWQKMADETSKVYNSI